MATITPVSGLASGLDTQGIVSKLIEIEKIPEQKLQDQVTTLTNDKTTIAGLSAQLLSLKLASFNLSQAYNFEKRTVSSTDSSVLTATATRDTPIGTYTFRSAALAQADQYLSNGFASDTDAIGAGTLTIEMGPADLRRTTNLSTLNDGTGVSPGKIKITNGSKSAVIDLSGATTTEDVLAAINAQDLDVTAGFKADGSGILLHNTGAGAISVIEQGGTTARNLGILKSGAAGADITGDVVNKITTAARLNSLNQGLGVRTLSGPTDMTVSVDGGAAFNVSLYGKTTLADVATAIQTAATAAGENLAVDVDPASPWRLRIRDMNADGGSIVIAAAGGSNAASDLGILGTQAGDTFTGGRVISKLGDVLLRSLNGFSGIDAASGNQFTITDSHGTATTITLSATHQTLNDLVADVNTQLGLGGNQATLALNAEGKGLLLTDTSGGATTLSVADVTGTTAAGLKLTAATRDRAGTGELKGGDVEMAWMSNATTLSSLNGGKGVFAGKISVTAKDGGSFVVDLSTAKTVGDVILTINSAATGAGKSVTAGVNATGDGILLSDSSMTGVPLQVKEYGGGTTANDLNLLQTASDTNARTIDGSFEFSFTIGAADTLQTVRDAINAKKLPLTVSVLNDGTGVDPYKLNIVGKQTGALAHLVIDSNASALSFNQTSTAQDAVLISNGTQLRGTTNTFKNVMPGLTVSLKNASASNAAVSVTRDISGLTDLAQKFVDSFNTVIDNIHTLDSYDATTQKAGAFLGDTTLEGIERQLYNMVTNPIKGILGQYDRLSRVGITIDKTGNLAFDTNALGDALNTDFDSVENLFTQVQLTGDTKLSTLNSGGGVHALLGQNDFRITLRDGSTLDVGLGGAKTVLDTLSAINYARAFTNGTADADSTTTTLEDDSLIGKAANDFYKGMEIHVTGGTNSGDIRKITGYNAVTGSLTVGTAFSQALDATSAYEIWNGGKVVASLGSDGRSFQLVDASGGAGTLKVTALNSSTAAAELGIANTAGVLSNMLTGNKLTAVTPQSGIGVFMNSKVDNIVNGQYGPLLSLTTSYDDKIALYTKQISNMEALLSIHQQRYTDQFTKMETLISQQQALSNFLTAQFAALASGSTSNSSVTGKSSSSSTG